MSRFDWLPVSALTYGAASFVHHLHNAVYLHAYPKMPGSLSVARVAAAWCLTALVGLVGYALTRRRHEITGLLCLTAYAALGLLGLAHYHLAPFSAHSPAMNATIGLEVATASVLLVVIARALVYRVTTGPASTG